MTVDGSPRARAPKTRRYPPLVLCTTAIAVLALVFPSSLRVPQQDPSPVLEYAPVPPTDDAPNPQGNMNTLALGSSSTTSEGIEDLPERDFDGEGRRPSNKRCVGTPLRQTEDPMSPPCVPFFDGDNGGATWQGVTKDEIRVIIYLDRGCPNFECAPSEDTYIDLDTPAQPRCPMNYADNENCDYIWIRIARGLNAYFNSRFQTYGRRVHYWAYIAGGGHEAARRSDAGDNWARLKPFAVIDYGTYFGNNDAYDRALAARKVLVFSSRSALPNSQFTAFPAFNWGFWPDVERWSRQYVDYVCKRVAPFPVSRQGNPSGTHPNVGKPRRFGLFYTTDESEPGLQYFTKLVRAGLKKSCGVVPVEEAPFGESGFAVDNRDSGADAADAVARFVNANVTTVLYLGGIEGKFSVAADSAKYYPEIVLAGDLENDNNYAGRIQNPNVWKNAWAMHFQLRHDRPDESIGGQAYREGSPEAPPEDSRFANEMYRDHFMLFQAIQVAGPRLNPENIDKGFHAIPPKDSQNPYVASCFFDPNDYTCVKDATEVWWDPVAQSPGDGQPGCWRLTNGGRRFVAGRWPVQEDVFRDPNDPCTGFDSRFQFRPG